MTIFAVISGAESWEDIEDFGETHLDFLKQYGDFENGIPVHDTIARVVSCISPAKFHECFINWMRDCHSSNDKDVIAIDGKTASTTSLSFSENLPSTWSAKSQPLGLAPTPTFTR